MTRNPGSGATTRRLEKVRDALNVALRELLLGGGTKVPTSGTVFVSVRDVDKPRVVDCMKLLLSLGFRICATGGTSP